MESSEYTGEVDLQLEHLLTKLSRPLPLLPGFLRRPLFRLRMNRIRVPVLVQLRGELTPQSVQRWQEWTVRHHGRSGPALEPIDSFTASLPLAAIAELRRNPEVALITLDHRQQIL